MEHAEALYRSEIFQKIAESGHPGYVKRRMNKIFSINLYALTWDTIEKYGHYFLYEDDDAYTNFLGLISTYPNTKITWELLEILKNKDYFKLFLMILDSDSVIVADDLLISIIEKGEGCVKSFIKNQICKKSDNVWAAFRDNWHPDTIYDLDTFASKLKEEADEKYHVLANKKMSKNVAVSSEFKNRLELIYKPENENAFNNFKTIIASIDEIDSSVFNSNLWEVIFDDVKFNNYLKFTDKPQTLSSDLTAILSSDSKSTAYLEKITALMKKFKESVNIDENSDQIPWCEDLILFHEIVPFILKYKENHYITINWLIKNNTSLLKNKSILEPDILIDAKLINNIYDYSLLDDDSSLLHEDANIYIDLLKKYQASTLKEFISEYTKDDLNSVPDDFLLEKYITENYMKLEKIGSGRGISIISEKDQSYSMISYTQVYDKRQKEKAYFLLTNAKILKLLTMSDSLTSIVANTYKRWSIYDREDTKNLIAFNHEILSIINSPSYRKLCTSKLELITNDNFSNSLIPNEEIVKTFKK